MSGLRDPWYRRAKIPGRERTPFLPSARSHARPVFFSVPSGQVPVPHAGAGNYKKEDILSRSPALWSAVRPMSRPAYLPSVTIASLTS